MAYTETPPFSRQTAGLWAPAHLSLSVPVAGNVTQYVCGGTTHNVNTLLQLEGALHPASTAGKEGDENRKI